MSQKWWKILNINKVNAIKIAGRPNSDGTKICNVDNKHYQYTQKAYISIYLQKNEHLLSLHIAANL